MNTQTLTFYASVATIVALIFSVVQLILARRETRHLKQIGGSLSTKYIGGLPDYYPHVLDLIQSARRSITILCDYPAYGCYTNVENWLAYRVNLIDKKTEDIPMILICPDAGHRSKNDKERYFPDAYSDWEQWIAVGENRRRASEFVDRAAIVDKDIGKMNFIANPQRDDFFKILQRLDEAMLNDCFNINVGVTQIKEQTPMDFWIVDGKKAVFAFSNYAGGASRSGFLTTDPKLIEAFQSVVGNYLRQPAIR